MGLDRRRAWARWSLGPRRASDAPRSNFRSAEREEVEGWKLVQGSLGKRRSHPLGGSSERASHPNGLAADTRDRCVPGRDHAADEFSLAGVGPTEAQDRVRATTQSLGGSALAFFFSASAAAVVPVTTFVERLHDLWYPSRDDVLLVSLTGRSFLAITHEEDVVSGEYPSDAVR